MKKALIVTRVSGFVPQFELSHVRILQDMGYEVHYAANYNTIVYGEDNSRLDGTGIIRHQVDFERSPFSVNVLTAARQLEEVMKKEQFDMIHCHMPMSGVVARICAYRLMKSGRCKRAPVLYTAHGFHFYKHSPWRNWLYYPAERYLARYTDRLITMNNEDYRRAGKFPVRGRVEKIAGAGIDLLKYRVADNAALTEEERSQAQLNRTQMQIKRVNRRKELGIRDDEFVIISVGELTRRKNHMLVIHTLQKCRDRNIKYLLCGSGPLEEELRAQVTKLNMEDRVIFAGYCTDIQEQLAAADCFVFPSLQEGLPMAVMEAMAAGLPVVGLPIRGNVDLIEHKKGGCLVRADAFAAAIMHLKGHKKLRQSMGAWNQKRIEAFDVHIVDGQMRRIYESADIDGSL